MMVSSTYGAIRADDMVTMCHELQVSALILW